MNIVHFFHTCKKKFESLFKKALKFLFTALCGLRPLLKTFSIISYNFNLEYFEDFPKTVVTSTLKRQYSLSVLWRTNYCQIMRNLPKSSGACLPEIYSCLCNVKRYVNNVVGPLLARHIGLRFFCALTRIRPAAPPVIDNSNFRDLPLTTSPAGTITLVVSNLFFIFIACAGWW